MSADLTYWKETIEEGKLKLSENILDIANQVDNIFGDLNFEDEEYAYAFSLAIRRAEALEVERIQLLQRRSDDHCAMLKLTEERDGARAERDTLKEENTKIKLAQIHEFSGIGKELEKQRQRAESAEARLAQAQSLVKQMYFFDEDEKNNIVSAIETAQNIGVFLDDLEESKANVTRLWEIKEMLDRLLEKVPCVGVEDTAKVKK